MTDQTTWGQPAPTPNDRTDVQTLVIHDIAARREHGIKTYGTPLQAFNGRDALWDAYEESLDQVMYLRQAIEERGTGVPEPPLTELQQQVWAWVNASFEPINRPLAFVLKAREEVDELIADGAAEEAADVAIAILAWCAHHEVSLGDLIRDKMRVNWERTLRGEWRQDANGVTSRPVANGADAA